MRGMINPARIRFRWYMALIDESACGDCSNYSQGMTQVAKWDVFERIEVHKSHSRHYQFAKGNDAVLAHLTSLLLYQTSLVHFTILKCLLCIACIVRNLFGIVIVQWPPRSITHQTTTTSTTLPHASQL